MGSDGVENGVSAMVAICHTHYSLQTGVHSPEEWVQAARDRGFDTLAIADVNGLYGAVHFHRAALQAGIHPIIGSTLHWGGDFECIALAASEKGYQQLCRIVTLVSLDPKSDLVEHLEGQTDEVLLLSRSPGLIQRLQRIAKAENVFALPCSRSSSLQRSTSLWDPLPVTAPAVVVPDSWFLTPDDRETFVYLKELRRRSGNEHVMSDEHPGVVLPSASTWRKSAGFTEAADAIAERCQFRFTCGEPLIPQIKLPTSETAETYLQNLCRAALPRLYKGEAFRAAEPRLDHELSAICGRGFADYFLFVHEIISFAQSKEIPVEVRGSAASSLVSYVLGFTHCCPLEHDLFFERFINPGRRDRPDIDIDIADNRRDEVIRFCYDRWGADHVAMISTVLKYRTRSAVRDAARLLDIPPRQVTAFLDEGKAIAKEDEMCRIASRLVGLPRHLGVHCGGLVITPCPLTDVTPLARAAKGIIITQYEKDQSEAIGLVKMDLLGNTALSVISESQQLLARRGVHFFEPGPASDFKVRRMFERGDTLGIYQCESPGMRQMCLALRPSTQREVSIALSLIRPGPAAAGMKDTFIRRKRGVEPVTYRHPRMADFLSSTYGVMLFQEDVMKVAVNLAGYSLADADVLRRAVSKDRGGGALAEEQHRFVFQKAPEAGVDTATAEEIWAHVSRFASYSYCKAHASVYGRLAWLTARLKAHYPREFYTALLNCHKSMYPTRVFVWDALRHGVPVLPPDVCTSDVRWKLCRGGIRAGLGVVKGLRDSLCHQIVSQARLRGFRDLADLRSRVGFNAGELESLILVGACRKLGDRDDLLAQLWGTGRDYRQLTLFADSHVPLPSLLDSELMLTEIPFSAHPVETDGRTGCVAANMGKYLNTEVCMTGILDARKRLHIRDRDGQPGQEMSFVTLEDSSGLFEAVLFPDVHRQFAHLFTRLGPYRVRGLVSSTWDAYTVELREAECA